MSKEFIKDNIELVKENYAKFLYNYNKKIISANKKRIDEMYKTTLYKINAEKDLMESRKEKYSIYSREQSIKKMEFEISRITSNFIKQIRPYTDKEFMIATAISQSSLLNLYPNDSHFIVEDEKLLKEIETGLR